MDAKVFYKYQYKKVLEKHEEEDEATTAEDCVNWAMCNALILL